MTSAVDWLRTTTPGLLVLCGLAIAILLFTIIKVKLEPFIALSAHRPRAGPGRRPACQANRRDRDQER